jgi:hypothetical protein
MLPGSRLAHSRCVCPITINYQLGRLDTQYAVYNNANTRESIPPPIISMFPRGKDAGKWLMLGNL